ncbi:MAG: TetR/AcrR family transcriptional regulator [Acidimicrobiales bacterium]|jgi:AcrR family transcriptional regulator|nr:TetR/AcrR family transcriptional regulator [Acidimicrobiales bacterium]HIE68448.1 TetR/AcrR family transcriptional regulator [Acidimicrobiia bacterium]|tara:strand:+ start:372 stop:950 length:579 start_codon:yes stop_codon:yes gene_type:complete
MSAPTADPPSTSRDALIEAAITLMSRRSPSTISGRDLAAEAGVNYGLVHYYFESARDLMAEARRLHGDWIVENLMDGGTRPVDPEAALADRRIFGFTAHVALEGGFWDPNEPRPALDALLELVRESDPDGDPVHHRATVAAVTLLLLGWPIFVEHNARGLGLDPDVDGEAIRSRFLGVLRSLYSSVGLEVGG